MEWSRLVGLTAVALGAAFALVLLVKHKLAGRSTEELRRDADAGTFTDAFIIAWLALASEQVDLSFLGEWKITLCIAAIALVYSVARVYYGRKYKVKRLDHQRHDSTAQPRL